MIYSYEKTLGIVTVFAGRGRDGAVVATFNTNTGHNLTAFQTFCAGVATTGNSLYSLDKKMFTIGTIDQLLEEI